MPYPKEGRLRNFAKALSSSSLSNLIGIIGGVVGILGTLVALQALRLQQADSILSDQYQATEIAILGGLLQVQREQATLQANPIQVGPTATFIAERLNQLSATQEALQVERARVEAAQTTLAQQRGGVQAGPAQLGDVTPQPTATSSTFAQPFPAEVFNTTLTAEGGEWGAVVYDLTTGTEIYAQNAQMVYSAAGLAQLPIALAVYEQAAKGVLDLDQQLTLGVEDLVDGTGSLDLEDVGNSYSIRELCFRMLSESDNTAGNLLLKRITFERVNEITTQLGARQTRVQRLFRDIYALEDNVITPADMVLLLRAIDREDLIGQTGTKEVLFAMQKHHNRIKIPRLLPAEAEIANKTGVLEGIEHDAAIITLGSKRYAIVLMGRDVSDEQAAADAMARASEIVYTWFAQRLQH